MERVPYPRFKNIGNNPAGYPILERVREMHADSESPETVELTEQQRSGLRLAIALVGGLGVVAGGSVGYKRMFDTSDGSEAAISEIDPHVTDEVSVPNYATAPEQVDTEKVPETVVESAADAEQFNRVVQRYEARLETPYDSIRFVDEAGNPIGEPVRYQEFVDDYPDGRAPEDNPNAQYRYLPSRDFDASVGFPTDGVSAEWIEYVREHGLPSEQAELVVGSVNVNPEFDAVFGNPDYAELQDLIRSGAVSNYEDVLGYFSQQPFAGAEGLDRYEYALAEVSFRNEDLVIPIEGGETVRRAVPEEVQEVFRTLLPGLIANESGFRDLTSDAGAQGPLQIKPEEWLRVTGEAEVDTDYARQVQVWGEIVSDFYDSTLDRIGEENLQVLRAQFDSEADFQREFASLVTLGAYNAGPQRMAEVVGQYVEHTPIEQMPRGMNLFQSITEFGAAATDGEFGGEYLDGYGSDASTYVQKLQAAANVLEERYLSGGRSFADLNN